MRKEIAINLAGAMLGVATMIEPLIEVSSKTKEEKVAIVQENQTRYNLQTIGGAVFGIFISGTGKRRPKISS